MSLGAAQHENAAGLRRIKPLHSLADTPVGDVLHDRMHVQVAGLVSPKIKVCVLPLFVYVCVHAKNSS